MRLLDIDNLINAVKSRENPIAFLVGSPLSVDTNGAGVPGVKGMIGLVRDAVRNAVTSNQVQRFEDAIAGKGSADAYQTAFRWLADNTNQGMMNSVIRESVLRAAKDPDAIEDGSDGPLDNWIIPAGTQHLAELVCTLNDRKGPIILTTNFDPLLRIAVQARGGKIMPRVFDKDGALPTEAETFPGSVSIIHLHGYWRNSDTFHTPEQLWTPRTNLAKCLEKLLSIRCLVVVAYGGWDDVFMKALVATLDDPQHRLDVLWCFRETDQEEIEKNNKHLPELMKSGGNRFRAFGGIDCHSIFQELRKAVEASPPRTQGSGQSSRKSQTSDVRIVYDDDDEAWAKQIDRELAQRGLVAEHIGKKPRISESATRAPTLVLVGARGFGPWSRAEMESTLSDFVKLGATVFPILLPGAPPSPHLLGPLSRIIWQDFRKGIAPRALDNLTRLLGGTFSDSLRSATLPIDTTLPDVIRTAKTRLVVSGQTLDRFSQDREAREAIKTALGRKVRVTFIQLTPHCKHADAHKLFHQFESRSSAVEQHAESLDFFRDVFHALPPSKARFLSVLFTSYMPRNRVIIVDDTVLVYFYMYATDVPSTADLVLSAPAATPNHERLRQTIIQSTQRLIDAAETLPFIRHGQVYDHWQTSMLASWDLWTDDERLRHRVIYDFYTRFAQEFHGRFGNTLELEVKAHLNRLSGRILVLGCGSGKEVRHFLTEHNPQKTHIQVSEIVGIDISPVAIELARREINDLREQGKIVNDCRCRFIVADFYDLAHVLANEHFDSIVANAAFVHLLNRSQIEDLFDGLHDRLNDRGLCFVRNLYKESEGQIQDDQFDRSSDRWDADRWFVYYSRKELGKIATKCGFDVLDDTLEIAKDVWNLGKEQRQAVELKGFRHGEFSDVFWPTLLLRKRTS